MDLRQLNKRALESLVKAGAMDGFGDRAALLAGLDTAMSLASSTSGASRTDRPASSTSSAPRRPRKRWPLPAFALPNVESAGRKQRLAWEKEMVGLYISEHPLAGMAPALGRRHLPHHGPHRRHGRPDGHPRRSISSMRIIATRKGDLMAALELEDLAGSVEVVVFPRTFQAHRELLQEDAIVLVKGKVDTRDDQPKLLCETVELFEVQAEDLAPPPEDAYRPAQTGYPLGKAEAEVSGFDAPSDSESAESAGDSADSAPDESPPLDAFEREDDPTVLPPPRLRRPQDRPAGPASCSTSSWSGRCGRSGTWGAWCAWTS